MKRILIMLILILTCSVAYCQQHVIKFIHFGEELKPVGTIVISVEQLIKPTDRPLDWMYGKSIQTDLATFMAIRNYIDTNHYALSQNTNPNHDTDGFEIVDVDRPVHYCYGSYYAKFFERLKLELTQEKSDQKVIEAFKYY